MTRLVMFMMGCLICCASAALPPVPEIPDFPVITSNGNTYHVHNEAGKDAGNDGTVARPWKTFEYAAGKLQAGDTLIIHGTDSAYPMNWSSLAVSGTEGQWITIEGRGGADRENVVFTGRLYFGSKLRPSVSHVYLRNIIFRGGDTGHVIDISPGSHHLAFENLEFDCQGNNKNRRAVWTGNNVSHVWYKDVTVHHCGYKRNAPGYPPPEEWKVPTDCGGICIKGDRIDNIVFLNVRATDNVGDGIGGGSKRAHGVSYFRNCISERNTGDGYDIGGTLTVFINSISRNNGGHQGAGFKIWSRELWLVNSVAYENYSVGVMVRPRHDGLSHAYLLNNTFAMNQVDRYGGQVATSYKDPVNGKLHLYIYNNIFYSLNSSAIVISDNSKHVIREEGHNYYYSAHDDSRDPHWTHEHAIHFRDRKMNVSGGYSFVEMAEDGRWNAVTGNGSGNLGEKGREGKMDPGFMDLGSGDLRLSSGSLAIDGGIDLGIVSDMDGNPVPVGSAPDMGAYEFSGSQRAKP